MGKRKRKNKNLFAVLAIIIIAVFGYFYADDEYQIGNISENMTENTSENIIANISETNSTNSISYETSSIPEYNGEIYITINDNIPEFSSDDLTLEDAYYSELVNGKVRNGNDKN